MQDIMTYDVAHYFDLSETSTPNIVLGGVITEMTESSNPTESTKQYIHQKSKTTKVTGYDNQFPLTMDMVKDDAVFENFYDKFYQRKTGTDLNIPHYIVDLFSPISGQTATYSARKIIQTVEITDCNGAAGEQKQISGALKGGDFVYGTFNTNTNTFTETVVSL